MSGPARREGHHIFIDELTRFAERIGDKRLAPIIQRVDAPLRVRVRGRAGVGRATVGSALTRGGVIVTDDAAAADVEVLVIAEAPKPEDRAVLSAANKPVLMVLNKADLIGLGGGGPMAVAQRFAGEYQAQTGVPTVPLVAPLATVHVDDELFAAVRVLAAERGDLTSPDAFLRSEHRLPREVRARLLAALDRFGIALSALAVGGCSDGASLSALLRRVSGIDGVLAQLTSTAAEVRYRRVRCAVAALQALAVSSGDDRLTDFLCGDDVLIAVMAAAVDVVEAAGLTVDGRDHAEAHLRRAVCWRGYHRGPLNALHRSCAADISRGSLRLLGRVPRPVGEPR